MTSSTLDLTLDLRDLRGSLSTLDNFNESHD
jgi:hypothetical protein